MKNLIIYILTIISIITNGFTQNIIENRIQSETPRSPEVSQLFKFMEIPVGLYTGTPQINIPIEEMKYGELSLPISLSYHGGGFKSSEIATATGLGWKLDGVAVITRRVHGSPDDRYTGPTVTTGALSPEGFIDYRNHTGYDESEKSTTATSTIIQKKIEEHMGNIHDEASNCADTEPDEFFININGITGQFSFDWENEIPTIISKHNLKILSYNRENLHTNPSYPEKGIITDFTIIDGNGIVYVFSERELSSTIRQRETPNGYNMCNLGGERGYVSSWFISEMYDSKNPVYKIEFHYDDYELTFDFKHTAVHTYLHPVMSSGASYGACNSSIGGPSNLGPGSTNYTTIKTKVNAKIITEIKTLNNSKSIKFHYLNNRTDINGIDAATNFKSLDSISCNVNNNNALNYKLNHFYNGRLMLESIQKIGHDGIKEPPYQFDYDNNAISEIGDKSIDHWGYSNGQNNSTLIPEINFVGPVANEVYHYSGGNREPNITGSKSSILEKITYPTGGYTTFDYELNDYSFIQNFDIKDQKQYEMVQVSEGVGTASPPGSQGVQRRTSNFSISDGRPVEVRTYGKTYVTFGQTFLPKLTIRNTSSGEVIFSKSFDVATDPTNGNYQEETRHLYLPPGNYEAVSQTRYFPGAPSGDYADISITYDTANLLAPVLVKPIGGVRIKEITNYNVDDNLVSQKKYDYSLNDSTSSGVIYKEPQYLYHRFKKHIEVSAGAYYDEHDCQFVDLVGTDRSVTSLIGSGHVGYSKVTVTELDGSNGKTVNYFTSPKKYGDIIFDEYPYQDNISNAFKCGNLIKSEAFNASNILVKKDSNVYDYKHIDISAAKIEFHEKWGSPGTLPSYSGLGGFDLGDASLASYFQNIVPFDDKVSFGFYDIRIGLSHLTKTISTIYNENGQEGITEVKEHYYDSYENLKWIKTWRDTDGNFTLNNEDHTKTEYFYLYDNVGVYNNDNSFKSDMELKNLLSIPFKTVISLKKDNGNYQIIDGDLFEYSKVNNKILLKKAYKNYYGNWVPSSLVTNYTSKGNINRVKGYKIGSSINSYVLDNNFTEYTWNNQDKITSIKKISDLGNMEVRYTYNSLNLLDTIIDHNGIVIAHVYDGLNRLLITKSGKSINNNEDFKRQVSYNYNYKVNSAGIIIPSNNNEIIKTLSFRDTLNSQVSTTLFDGLGREVMQKRIAYSPTNNDVLMSKKQYDSFGRILHLYSLGVDSITKQYESSPLSRNIGELGPTGSNTLSYGTNRSPIAIGSRLYPIGSLSKSLLTDVDGSISIIYHDFLGNKVLIERMVTINGTLETVKTQFIYNRKNQLIEVIPAEGPSYLYTYNDLGWLISKSIPGHEGNTELYYDQFGKVIISIDPNGNLLTSQYDDLGREIKNGVNNSINGIIDATNHIINANENLVDTVYNETIYAQSQTGSPLDWIQETKTLKLNTTNGSTLEYLTTSFTYDDFGRAIIIDEENHIGGNEIKTNVYDNADNITNTTIGHNFGNSNFGITKNIELKYTFDHSLRLKNTYLKPSSTSDFILATSNDYNEYNQLSAYKLNKLVSGDYLQTINYEYDNSGRLIKINDLTDVNQDACNAITSCDLYISIDTNSSPIIIDSLTFIDSLGESKISNINYPFTLDNTTSSELIDSIESWILTEGFVYDEVTITNNNSLLIISQTNATLHKIYQGSKVSTSIIANCCEETTPQKIFAQEINYNNTGSTIDNVKWSTPCVGVSKYEYQYDELRRLTNAQYYEAPTARSPFIATGSFNVNIEYDKLGNITSLERFGLVNNNVHQIDNLKYNYDNLSGRLTSVTDGNSVIHMKNGQMGSTSYLYDDNGNLVTDQAKGLILDYNAFNLPKTITKVGSTNHIENTYLGNKNRIKKKSVVNNQEVSRDYVGYFQYTTVDDSTNLDGVYLDFGRIKYNSFGEASIEYYVKDYLGSIRVIFKDRDNNDFITKNDIIQENHQYPFGLNMNKAKAPQIGTINNYQLNGKEWENELDVNWYNYGARYYDPAIARWNAVDPLAEEFSHVSTYNYVLNNPTQYIDPDGKAPTKADGAGGPGGPFIISPQSNGAIHVKWMTSSTRKTLRTTYYTAAFALEECVPGSRDVIEGIVNNNTGQTVNGVRKYGQSHLENNADKIYEAIADGYNAFGDGPFMPRVEDQIRNVSEGWGWFNKVKGWYDLAKEIGGEIDSPPTQEEVLTTYTVQLVQTLYFDKRGGGAGEIGEGLFVIAPGVLEADQANKLFNNLYGILSTIAGCYDLSNKESRDIFEETFFLDKEALIQLIATLNIVNQQ